MKTYIAAIALATALPCSVAQTAAAADSALACSDIKDAAARLECFDRSSSTAREPASSATSANPPTQSVTPQASGKPADAWAIPQSDEQLKGRDQSKIGDEVLPLQARIAEARRGSGGLYVIILDNGQAWRHESGSMQPYLKVGEAVTIRKGTLGSHRLTLDSGSAKNWVRVTRVR